jgi:hypothetical protein
VSPNGPKLRLQGHPIGAVENVPRLRAKVFKLATDIGLPKIKALGHQSKHAFIEDKLSVLTSYP